MQNNDDVRCHDARYMHTCVNIRSLFLSKLSLLFFRYDRCLVASPSKVVPLRVHARPPFLLTSRRAYYALHEREKWPRFGIDNTGWPSVLREHVLNTGGRKRRSNNGVFRRCPRRVKHGGVKRATWPRYTVYPYHALSLSLSPPIPLIFPTETFLLVYCFAWPTASRAWRLHCRRCSIREAENRAV